MNTFLNWFLQATIATAILIPVVSGLSWLFRNRPSVRHALWVVVLLKFATPPIASLPVVVPAWILPTIIPSSLPQVSESESEFVVIESRIESSLLKSHHDIRNNPADLAESTSPESRFEFGENRIELVALSTGRLWLVRLAALVWMTGILVLAIKHFRSLRQQVRLLSRSASASPELQTLMTNVAKKLGSRPLPIRVVPGIVTPFVWCLGRLKIIWPEGMAGAESIRSKQMIIAHELSHVRRRDHWIAWIELVAGLIWWWNPLFWFVCKNIRVNSEMACDALALEQFPEDRGIYAETLFALSVSRTGEPPLVLAVGDGTPSILERRISMMMHDHISGKFSLCGLLVAGLLTAGTLPMLTLGQESLQDSNRKAPVSSETTTTNVRSIALSRVLNILEANPPQLSTRSNELAQHLTLTIYGMSNPLTESRLAEGLARRGKSRAIRATMRPNDETLPQLASMTTHRLSFQVDNQELLSELGEMVDSIYQSKVMTGILEGLALDPVGPKIDVKRELLTHLGSTWVVVNETSKPEFRWLVAVSVNDQEAVARVIDRLFRALPGFEIAGKNIYVSEAGFATTLMDGWLLYGNATFIQDAVSLQNTEERIVN